MAITVKDIREKDFGMASSGYDADQVDEFLDAVAEQMESVIRENIKMKAAYDAANKELEDAKAALEEKEKAEEEAKNVPAVCEESQLPAFNEPSYFKNLETTLRETLISAQRIADETIDDARKKARKIVADAEEQAATLQEQSAAKMAEAKADYDQLKNASEEYRKNFSALVEGQAKLLKESALFE